MISCYKLWCQVFSFLNHMDLCRAALVCRQWRAASAHEDFWKCLNFENRINISIEQCECQDAKMSFKPILRLASGQGLKSMHLIDEISSSIYAW